MFKIHGFKILENLQDIFLKDCFNTVLLTLKALKKRETQKYTGFCGFLLESIRE